eukprot:GFKZ01010661.1.p1 GENE.GFKZ01010661.1~~GFKZ01010661.1.p1  ORF type:complete len:398 (+),score=46.83 GFKZ01010661.1:31-1194(+)
MAHLPLATTLILLSLLAPSRAQSCPPSVTLAIGSYTGQPWLPSAAGDGISLFRFTPPDLTPVAVLPPSSSGTNPSYLATTSSALLAVNENDNATLSAVYFSTAPPFVTSQTIDLQASAATHLSPLPDTDLIAIAAFNGQVVTARLANQSLSLLDVFDIPPFNQTNQTIADTYWQFSEPHPHMALPFKRGILVPDLGSNTVWVFSVRSDGTLAIIDQVILEPTDGPRHAVLHHSGAVYVVNEVSLTLVVLREDVCAPGLRKCQRRRLVLDDLPFGTSAAAIRLSDDQRFLYVSVRLPDDQEGLIVAFEVKDDGKVGRRVGTWGSGGVHPRDFDLVDAVRVGDRCDSFVVVVNRDSDNVVVRQRDVQTGVIGATVVISNVTTPTSVLVM